ncbi:MAG: response regulator transcription factor [Anaerolineaceae bacterium]|nr:response regulator transcription factor [Anaerolineaceae bacterium]
MNEKIVLIVDDKFSVTRLVSDYLNSKGFKTITAWDGNQALTEARINHPDIILLDIMMPHMDGFEFIKTYRKESNTPIILLTAKIEESDKVIGLGLGADDYVTKPFGMAELAARVHAVLRRSDPSQAQNLSLQFGDLSIDPDKFEVLVKGKEITLTPTEFQLLNTLAQNPGRVFTREQLLCEIQGEAYDSLEKTINVHIRNLRVKIEKDPGKPKYIQTVFGVGYRFADIT